MTVIIFPCLYDCIGRSDNLKKCIRGTARTAVMPYFQHIRLQHICSLIHCQHHFFPFFVQISRNKYFVFFIENHKYGAHAVVLLSYLLRYFRRPQSFNFYIFAHIYHCPCGKTCHHPLYGIHTAKLIKSFDMIRMLVCGNGKVHIPCAVFQQIGF